MKQSTFRRVIVGIAVFVSVAFAGAAAPVDIPEEIPASPVLGAVAIDAASAGSSVVYPCKISSPSVSNSMLCAKGYITNNNTRIAIQVQDRRYYDGCAKATYSLSGEPYARVLGSNCSTTPRWFIANRPNRSQVFDLVGVRRGNSSTYAWVIDSIPGMN